MTKNRETHRRTVRVGRSVVKKFLPPDNTRQLIVGEDFANVNQL